MDRKEDEENPPGFSYCKHKRKHKCSPEMMRKKKKTEAFDPGNPPENLPPEITPVLPAAEADCPSDTNKQSTNLDENEESTDSDCSMDQPTLLEQLKTILDSYQDAQIIRELVQNADDAAATEMKIVYVNDGTGTIQGANRYSEYFRTPALCVYNNALFSKQDWKYIKSIYNSGKREDALKVGRFGLGFKSVFHITDNPVIISNDRAMIIDPFGTRKGYGNECQILTFKKLRKSLKSHHEQALAAMTSVFGNFGFTQQSVQESYSGSIFWFPLRRSPSELSSRVFDQSDVTELIAMFKKEAACLPLFLKNICLVAFSDEKNKPPSFSVQCNVLENEEKQSFNRNVKACSGVSPNDSMKAIFRVNISVEEGQNLNERSWVVCNYIKGKKHLSPELRALTEDKQLSYSPFVGLATPVDDNTELHGQVFCFLPLPNTSENQTGLPMHVNGFFALSQDRHHVKWPPDDVTERVDQAQRWNRLLCEEVLVDAYVDTVEFIKSLGVDEHCTSFDTNMVYSILPSQTDVRPNWDSILSPLCRRLEDHAIFYTKNGGGKWIKGKDAIFSILQCPEDQLESNTIPQTEQCLFDLLLKYKRDVVKVPPHVAEMFPCVPKITPRYVRNVIRECDIYSRDLSVKQQLTLLQFILADQQYEDLHDLVLLPLEDDTFRTFDPAHPVDLCTASEIKMFPGIERKFIKLDLPQQIVDHLKEMDEGGFCNIKPLNIERFPSLLKATLEENGKVGDNRCYISDTNHITMAWLDRVWSYIGHKYDVMEVFEEMHLVPVRDNATSGEGLELMPLKGFYLVADCEGMSQLDQTLQKALSKLPITVVRQIAKGETHTCLMGTYCKYPNPEGLLKLLENLCEDGKRLGLSLEEMVRQFNVQSSYDEKKALLQFLAKDGQHSSPHADALIRELNIFPETTNENDALEYTAVAKNERIACKNNIPVKYHLPHLHLDNLQRMLAERLGAKEIPETKMIESILQAMTNLPDLYERSSIEMFMMYVLKYCSKVSSTTNLDNIIGLGSRIKFVEDLYSPNTTELAPIHAFFDHSNKELKKLFHFQNNKFLSEKYREEELVSVLRKFGLKSEKDVKEDDILAVIQELHHVVQELDLNSQERKQAPMKEIRNCSLKVMEILDKMEMESTVNLALNEYRWITFVDKKPAHYPDVLSWFGDQFEFPLCTPQYISSNKYETQVASVRCVIEDASFPSLSNRYGWNRPPDPETCLLQLKAVRDVFCSKHKAKLNGVLKDIYQQLFYNISSLDNKLKTQPIICTGEKFHLPEHVFISFPSDENIHLEPYMYKIPDEFAEFSEMFVLLGTVQELDINSLKIILTRIANATKSSTAEEDRQMAVKILRRISNLRDSNESLSDVLVPVQSCNDDLVLQPVKDCTYSDEDSSWLQNEGDDDDVNYVHCDVGTKLAESLGVQSFTQRFLSDGGTNEMIAECGQSEPLPTRLKHLLENYPDGLAVLKELIQNADDAGAKCIHFLYDERQNKDATVGLIDTNMAKCQGPAFWAFNDAVFTDRDFENIVKLGGETKKAMRTKIGKFGLGFCAVYNITDVPSFVSGSSLVIFDPHTTHLGKAIRNKSSPGIRLTISEKSSGMLKRMKNQFMPYNKIFGCDLTGNTKPLKFEGTLFRFPLRTKQQALDSEIRSTPYCKDDMVKLLHLLKNCAGDLLTFTQNLKEIKLFHLQEGSINPPSDIQLIFSAEKEIHRQLNNSADTNVMKEAENLADINVMKKADLVLETKQPFTHTEMVSLNIHTFRNELLNIDEACLTSSPWLISWASGTKPDVLDKATQLKNDGALPLGSVAVSLKDMKSPLVSLPFPHKEKLHGLYDQSHIFCFLPLPVECQLPVHINGCFAVSSDRKGLVKSTCDEKSETESQVWNRMLMSDAVCNAILSLLKSLELFGVSSEEIYSTLWPVRVGQSDEATCLSDAFCKAVVREDVRVFYTPQGCRASFRESTFLDSSLRYHKTVGEYAFEIFTKFYSSKRIPMDMSQELYQGFCRADCEEDLVQQTMTINKFYENVVFPNIQVIDAEKRDALVMHILTSNDQSLKNLLKSNQCIPVLPDGMLRPPHELVRPRSAISDLFYDEDSRFPSDVNQPFSSERSLDILVQLGMMDRILPDDLVVERAQSISKLSKRKPLNFSFQRCRKLLAYLHHREQEENACHSAALDILSETSFLPALKKPNDWPLTWFSNKNETDTFFPPNQMFFPGLMERIACSRLMVNVEELRNVFDVQKILKRLGVKNTEQHGDVEKQLVAISRANKLLSDKQKLRLTEICISVYEYLNKSSEDLTENYDDTPILWISDQLVAPNRATIEKFERIDCAPEICQVPSSHVSSYGTFLKRIGLQELLTKEKVILALERVATNHDENLKMDTIDLLVSLLGLLSAVCSRRACALTSDEKNRIYLPDDTNILRSIDKLCVDDEFPMKRQKYMHFVNSKVSREITKLLGIKTKRTMHLSTIKGSMPFGQKEQLVTRLKGILDEYPRDETILYELLQNADDAGAKEIMFIEDMRQHKTQEGIFDESWSDVQGPALCVFNDSCFSVADLEGICKLGQGSKSQDPTKTGQFGIGFNAVYHLTDVPSFITRGPSTPNKGTFCAFDPHCKYCPTADESNPGLQLPDLEELEEIYPGVYECYLQTELPRTQGTWFRFPLRTSKMAGLSQVCDRPIQKNSLRKLLQQFKQNMKKCLLFLRNIRQISLCEIDHGNIKENYRVESKLNERDEFDLKEFFVKCDADTKALFVESKSLLEIPKRTIQYNMTIEEAFHKPEQWIIAQTFGLDACTMVPDSVTNALELRDINLTPKSAVALPCTPEDMDCRYEWTKHGNYTRHEDTLTSFDPERFVGESEPTTPDQLNPSPTKISRDCEDSNSEGQVFCFLPLPLKTGLPVHINGHFALRQTRGAMWDDKGYRGDWNSLLLETTIPESYIAAIEYMRDTFLETIMEGQIPNNDNLRTSLEVYHNSFPRFSQVKSDPIKCMVSSFFAKLYHDESTVFPVLSPITKPIWWVGLTRKEHAFPAFFNNLTKQYQTEAELALGNYKNAYILDISHEEKNKRFLKAENDAHQLSDILKDTGMKVLESPVWINDSIKKAFENLEQLRIERDKTQKIYQEDLHILDNTCVLRFLRTVGKSTEDVCLVKDVNCDLTDTPIKNMGNMLCLLHYCLKDKRTFLNHMERLPLLVTNDGMLRRFSTTPVFLSEFCDLLPKSSKEFVHRKIVDMLEWIELDGRYLKKLDLNSFAKMLPDSKDMTSLSGNEPIPWDQNNLERKWIQEFWRYLDTLQANVKDLGSWCLIPGQMKCTEQNNILVPCNKGFVLMSVDSFAETSLRTVLASLQLPKPHPCIRSKTMKNVVTSQHNLVRFVECLHYHKDALTNLTPHQCTEVLQFLSGNLRKPNKSVTKQIKDLPLFTTVYGKCIELNENVEIYVVENGNFPTNGLDTWSEKCNVALLKHNFYTSDLMSYLGCKDTSSIIVLYCKLILPFFQNLSRENHLVHLEYVRGILNYDLCSFKHALQETKFIFHEETFRKASYFYSPHNRLCKKLCDQSMLPPYPFRNEEWEKFMVYAGMKESVPADLYFKFATQIEQSAIKTGMTKEIIEQSQEMVRYLFETEQLSKDRNLLEKIKNIRFIEPYRVEQGYSEIHPQFGCETLIAFCGSVPRSLALFVWSTMSILRDYCHPHDQQMRECLGILLIPPLTDVLSHTHNVCNALNKNTERKYGSNVTELMREIYTYLQDNCINTSETKRLLSETPLVHMKESGIFVTARQVSISFGGKKQIPPYLFEIPLHYGQFVDLFKFVGTTESVTLAQYSDVLYRIHGEVGTSVLGPDQIKDVLTTLTGFMMLLQEENNSRIEESMAPAETLYLPASDKTLVKSTVLVYVDKKKLRKRVNQGSDHGIMFMHSLKSCHETEDLILKLPERIKPKRLSLIVQEKLIPSFDNASDEKVATLQSFLSSARFLKALKQIGKLKKKDFDCYKQKLLKISFVTLSEIKTVLHVNGRSIHSSEDTQECFCCPDQCYIAASTQPVRNWLKKIGKQLCEMLSDCFEKRISPEKFRELIDYVDDPTGFKSYCEELLDEEESDDDSLSYHPGQLVPVGLHALLQNNIIPLEIGDVVAYEVSDPAIDDDNADVDTGVVYVFVRIVEELESVHQESFLKKYKVNFGQDKEQTVLGLRLYKVIYPKSSDTNELVLYQFGNDRSSPANRDKVFDLVIVTLSSAWKLPESDRKRVVKRLLLAWHPDKNRDRGDEYETFCKEVTQFIFDIIHRLENGESFEDEPTNESDRQYHTESDGGSCHYSHFGNFGNRRRWKKWDYDNWQYGGGCSSSWQTFTGRMFTRYTENQDNFWQYHRKRKSYIPDPQRAEGERWFRQAGRDYLSGVNSMEASCSTNTDNKTVEDCNWICFKFHQACEKACKAYMYSIDAKKVTRYHYLPNILPYDDALCGTLRDIENLVGSYSRMRYPDVLEYPRIPGTMYTLDQANKLRDLTEQVMNEIESRIRE